MIDKDAKEFTYDKLCKFLRKRSRLNWVFLLRPYNSECFAWDDEKGDFYTVTKEAKTEYLDIKSFHKIYIIKDRLYLYTADDLRTEREDGSGYWMEFASVSLQIFMPIMDVDVYWLPYSTTDD